MGDSKAYINLTDGITISIKDASPNSHFSLTEIQSQNWTSHRLQNRTLLPHNSSQVSSATHSSSQVSLACRGQLILGELSQKRSAHPKRAQPKELSHTAHSLNGARPYSSPSQTLPSKNVITLAVNVRFG